MDLDVARKTFEVLNSIVEVDATDSIYRYDAEEQQQILQQKPWTKECVWYMKDVSILLIVCASPHYFKRVKISAIALVKMVQVSECSFCRQFFNPALGDACPFRRQYRNHGVDAG